MSAMLSHSRQRSALAKSEVAKTVRIRKEAEKRIKEVQQSRPKLSSDEQKVLAEYRAMKRQKMKQRDRGFER